jgi:hypothetical protein
MKLLGVLGMACLFLAAGAANALTFIATTSDPITISVSDTVTIEITVVLDAGDSVNAVGSSVDGWDNSVVSFTDGQGVSEIFFQTAGTSGNLDSPVCAMYPSSCMAPTPPSDGILTNKGAPLVEGIAGGGGGFTGQPEVEIIAGVDLFNLFVPQAGFQDIGLDGNEGTAQFSLTFHATSAGETTLIIGTGSDLNGAAGPTVPNGVSNASITISVVPEPGTALLMGLGLAGLAAAGRRQLK